MQIKKVLVMLAALSLCSGDTSVDYVQVQRVSTLLEPSSSQSMETSMLLAFFQQHPEGSYIAKMNHNDSYVSMKISDGHKLNYTKRVFLSLYLFTAKRDEG